MINGASAGIVTRQQAEEAMFEAFETLARMPDAERSFQMAGSRSCWPQIVRSIREGDYGEGQGFGEVIAPSAQTTRRMVARLDAILLGPRAAALAIREGQRSFVGRVIVMQLWPGAEGFSWERVWIAMNGRREGMTSDAYRARYDRAIGLVAKRMTALDLAATA